MGNTVTLQQSEGSQDMLFKEATLKELNSRVHLVDNAVTGLARAIDALQSMSLQFGSAETPKIAEAVLIGESEVESLQSLVESISNIKTVTIHEVREFLNFVLELGKNFIEGDIYFSTQLSVNMYQPPDDTKHTQHDYITEYFNARIEHLEKEVELLKDIDELQRQEIEQLRKRQKTYLGVNEWIIYEKNTNDVSLNVPRRQRQLEDTFRNTNNEKNEQDSKKQIEINDEVPGRKLSELCKVNKTHNLYFEEGTPAFRTRSEKEGEDITSVIDEDKEIIRLQKGLPRSKGVCFVLQDKGNVGSIDLRLNQTAYALETKGCKAHMKVYQEEAKNLGNKKTIYAQVYNLPLFSARETAEKLMLVVQRKLALRNIEMQVEKLRKPNDVDVSMPLLIYCEPALFFPGMTRSVQMALGRFNNVTKNMAVLFFHNKDEVRFRKDIERLGSFNVGSLGDIIQIGHKISMQDFETNDASVDSIVNFILTNGDIKQTDEVS